MEKAIGVFDSGVGGLSLLPALTHLMPHEDFYYLADEAYSPYGEKSENFLLARSILITQHLLSQNCKLIVVACNTATTQIIQQLRDRFSIPFVGIEPAIKPAAQNSKAKKIGVLATQGTLNSELFLNNLSKNTQNIAVFTQVGNGLVKIVEEGNSNHSKTKALLTGYLTPMIDQGIDQLVLGCTHYPFLRPLIEKIVPPSIKIIDNSKAVALQVQHQLRENLSLNQNQKSGEIRYFSTRKDSNLAHFISQEIIHLPL